MQMVCGLTLALPTFVFLFAFFQAPHVTFLGVSVVGLEIGLG